ncbi:hypothetical protein [Marivita sp.]|uniref:hypothetical protein n=1 Tax=Marivita sp. TaxID=2003365 RepID=UPI0025B8353A|nr:hypothetical protein [Marivita sp.]
MGLLNALRSAFIDDENIEEVLQAADEKAKQAHALALAGHVVSNQASKQLKDAADGIAAVRSKISTVQDVHDKMDAFFRIKDAVEVLEGWPHKGVSDEAAAAAFDEMFGAAAVFAESLPPPLNQYAQILKQVKVASFFQNMQGLGASRVGGNASTPTGRQMQKINEILERQGRGEY